MMHDEAFEDGEAVDIRVLCRACREPVSRGYGRSRGILRHEDGYMLTASLHPDCAIPDGWTEWR